MKNEKNEYFQMIILSLLITLMYYCTPGKGEERFKFSIFFTGKASGELEPCGCSGEKTGGILNRSGWVTFLREKKDRLILIDGGFASETQDRQSELKEEVYHKALNVMGYNVRLWRVGERLFDSPPQLLPDIRENAPKKLTVFKDYPIYIIGVDFNLPGAEARLQESIDVPSAFILLAGGEFEIIKKAVSGYPNIALVLLADEPEPWWKPASINDTLFVSAGKKGRYADLMDIEVNSSGKLTSFKHEVLHLKQSYPPQPEVSKLIEIYKKSLKEEGLLEKIVKISSNIGFVGSEYCKKCHSSEMKIWLGSKHSRAMESLQREGHEYDPECVPCHVVGFSYVEGFSTIESSPHLKEVGCESCHGPGAKHSFDETVPCGKTDGLTLCLSCHTPERSVSFDYPVYMEKIKHWR